MGFHNANTIFTALVNTSPSSLAAHAPRCMKQHEQLANRDSSVGIAIGYGFDGRGLIPGRGKSFLLCTASTPTLWPTQYRIQ
jgi:hypothetical protein